MTVVLYNPPHLERLLESFGRVSYATRLLYRRPEAFIARFLSRARPAWLVLFAWAYGTAFVLELWERQLTRGEPWPLSDTWPRFCALVLGLGLLQAAFFWHFGGWFFKLRLWLSGVDPIDGARARAVYLSIAQIETVPVLLWAGAEALFFASPAEASAEAGGARILLLVFNVWALVATYRAVTVAFDAPRWRLRFWFGWAYLIAPLLLFGGFWLVGEYL